MAERTGNRPHRLDSHGELPIGYGHLWTWYQQLAARRDSALGFRPLAWSEMYAWSQLTGNRPDAFELDLLTSIDDLVVAKHAELQRTRHGGKA